MQTATTRDDVASGWKYWGNLTKASNHNQELRPLQVPLPVCPVPACLLGVLSSDGGMALETECDGSTCMLACHKVKGATLTGNALSVLTHWCPKCRTAPATAATLAPACCGMMRLVVGMRTAMLMLRRRQSQLLTQQARTPARRKELMGPCSCGGRQTRQRHPSTRNASASLAWRLVFTSYIVHTTMT